jgi:hypothetical protein
LVGNKHFEIQIKGANMSTTCVAPSTILRNGARNMNTQPQLKPALVDIVRKIHALRTVTKKTGFITNRTIGEMLMKLSPDDLIAVGEALQLKCEDFEHYVR